MFLYPRASKAGVLIQTHDSPLVSVADDARGVGRVLSTSLYRASQPSTKTQSEDIGWVGNTEEGLPALMCVDGFHGCQAKAVHEFLEIELLPLLEHYARKLRQCSAFKTELPTLFAAWQRDIFAAKKKVLHRGIDFTLAVVVTFEGKDGVLYTAGWSVGDIGVLYLADGGKPETVLPMTRVKGFKDGFDDYYADTTLQAEVIARAPRFIRAVAPKDQWLAFTYVPAPLQVTMTLPQTPPSADVIYHGVDVSGWQLQNGEDFLQTCWRYWVDAQITQLHQRTPDAPYRLGDDCTLCLLTIPTPAVRYACIRDLARSRLLETYGRERVGQSWLPGYFEFLGGAEAALRSAAKAWAAALDEPNATPQEVHPSAAKQLASSPTWGRLWQCWQREAVKKSESRSSSSLPTHPVSTLTFTME